MGYKMIKPWLDEDGVLRYTIRVNGRERTFADRQQAEDWYTEEQAWQAIGVHLVSPMAY